MSVHSRIELVLSYGNIDITENDMDCLKPSTFINDNIINFYLKYMYRCMLNENQQQKVHIFDSFFCEALDQMDDARVIRWLRRVNIFEKDYLVIPAMIDQHWFLIIIRRPGNILHSITATEFNNANSYITHGRRPAILIMDSAPDHVKDKKPQMINYLYNFIRIACSVNGKYISVKHLRSHVPVREIDAKVQGNNFDCGVHLLENVEQFFMDTFDIPHEVNTDIEFRLTNARRKRDALQKLIDKLAEAIKIEQSVMKH